MLNNFKAKVQKWAGIPWPDFCKLVTWLDLSQSPVELDNPNLQFASVTNQRGDIVGCVPFEKVFLVSADAVAQTTTPSEDQPAAFAASEVIECEAQKEGVGKVLLVLSDDHPSFPNEKWIRVVEQQIPQAVVIPEYRCSQSPAEFLN